jgi:hypothetical protein
MSSETDDLYGLALDEFVPARDALAKRLRAEGRREEADEIAALRKPSVAAWAANQAVRTQPKAARELWAAGDALRKAHAAVVGGKRRGTGDALREATARQRAALRPLVEAASCLLDHRGHSLSRQTIERAGDTLHAAALDPALREDAAAGRLTTDHRYAGLA